MSGGKIVWETPGEINATMFVKIVDGVYGPSILPSSNDEQEQRRGTLIHSVASRFHAASASALDELDAK